MEFLILDRLSFSFLSMADVNYDFIFKMKVPLFRRMFLLFGKMSTIMCYIRTMRNKAEVYDNF